MQQVTAINKSQATLECTVRPGSSERWQVTPGTFKLRPGQAVALRVQLKLLRFAATKKAEEAGQRDVFHVKVKPLPCVQCPVCSQNLQQSPPSPSANE